MNYNDMEEELEMIRIRELIYLAFENEDYEKAERLSKELCEMKNVPQ